MGRINKEERRETLGFGLGPLPFELMPEERAGGADPDPSDERSYRDVLREGDEKN